MIAHDLARREALVRDFIVAASKTYGDALGNNEPKMPEIVDLYAMVNRMRVLSMRKTTRAQMLLCAQSSTPISAPKDVADLRELVRTGQGIDPLKDFSEAGARGTARVRVLSGPLPFLSHRHSMRPRPVSALIPAGPWRGRRSRSVHATDSR